MITILIFKYSPHADREHRQHDADDQPDNELDHWHHLQKEEPPGTP